MTDTTSTGGPAVTVPAATYTGATAHMVRIRAEHGGDEPGVRLVGLPTEHAWTTRDRLRAALVNSGLTCPAGPLTLAVFPRDLLVGDSGLDLAFALALLAATGQLPADRVTGLACLGELGLDGSLRPVPGLTARARAVAAAAIPNTVVAAGDLPAAVPILGGSVQAASSLADLVGALRGGTSLQRPAAWPVAPTLAGADLAQVAAAHPGRRALEVAAAGGHHLALSGPPGCGGLLLARLLPGLLPDIDVPAAEYVAAMYRAAGRLTSDAPVMRRPPRQAPHHTSSLPALTGTTARPGAFGLAHGGVLLFEDAGEWPTRAVQALLSALHHGQVVATRADSRTVHPTRFQLVLTARGCPHAETHRDGPCDCPPATVTRYRQRLTPLLDAAEIRISLPASTPPAGGPVAGEASHTVAARVARARAIAAARWSRYDLTLNRELGTGALGTDLAGSWAAQVTTLQVRPDAGHLSFLAASRVLAVAYTVADLAGRDRPGEAELAEAIALHGNPVSGDTTGEVR